MCDNGIDIRTDTELSDVAKLFYGDAFPDIRLISIGQKRYCVELDGKRYDSDYNGSEYDIIPSSHIDGRLAKIAIYDALAVHNNTQMPWGALTGVRPTKLFYECLHTNPDMAYVTDIMQRIYRVSPSRANVLQKIIDRQRGKVFFDESYCNLYIHIPYCTTRCTYCSFVSVPIEKHEAQSSLYIDLLCREIERSLELLKSLGKIILSVYIGGGTPTALSLPDFEKLLQAVGNCGCEYTCEAGRPDTVTKEKCDIMKAYGVTRICVNPQTLCDKTLPKIGRSHTVADFYNAFDIAKSRGFDINCDLIAGLCDETAYDFAASYNGIKNLRPQNFTVHSLSKKNGSAIRYAYGENSQTSAMLDYALENCEDYHPYYLYRQKRQSGNLENVGFCLSDKQCINNITTMEETVSVLACGAGAISKVVTVGNISRFANMRDVGLYINRFDEQLKSKLEFFYRHYRQSV